MCCTPELVGGFGNEDELQFCCRNSNISLEMLCLTTLTDSGEIDLLLLEILFGLLLVQEASSLGLSQQCEAQLHLPKKHPTLLTTGVANSLLFYRRSC